MPVESVDLPDGVQQARVFYNVAHTLSGLDGAAATTWNATDDDLIILGAVGWACFGRALHLSETKGVPTTGTPAYSAVAEKYLTQFRAGIAPRKMALMRRAK